MSDPFKAMNSKSPILSSNGFARANEVLTNALKSNFQWSDVHFASAHNKREELEKILKDNPSAIEVSGNSITVDRAEIHRSSRME